MSPRGVEGRRRDSTRSSAAAGSRQKPRSRSTRSACASARCAATAQALTIKLREDLPLARDRAPARRRQRVGARRSQHARGQRAQAHAGGGHRNARHSDRAAAQARDGRRIPRRVHRRRPAAVGRRRAAAAHAAHPASDAERRFCGAFDRGSAADCVFVDVLAARGAACVGRGVAQARSRNEMQQRDVSRPRAPVSRLMRHKI